MSEQLTTQPPQPLATAPAPAIQTTRFDWQRLGADAEETALMLQFEEAAKMTFMGMIGITQGGTMKAYLKLARRFEHVCAELRRCEAAAAGGGEELDLTELKMYHKQFMDLTTQMLKYGKEAVTSAKERMIMEGKMKEIKEQGKKLVLLDKAPVRPAAPPVPGNFTMQPKPETPPAAPAPPPYE